MESSNVDPAVRPSSVGADLNMPWGCIVDEYYEGCCGQASGQAAELEFDPWENILLSQQHPHLMGFNQF